MKLMVISTLGAVHRHVVAELARAHPIEKILHPVRTPAPPAPLRDRLQRWTSPPARLPERLREAFERRVRTRRMEQIDARVTALLFGESPPVVPAEDIATSDLNTPATAERLRPLAPDYVIVSGAPILRAPILSVPRHGTVNLHYGIAPAYRGEDTLFWPLVHQDFNHLGVTLHYVDSGVDSGHILAQGFVERRGGETEAELWATSARLGARLVQLFVTAAERGRPRGIAQEKTGKQYFRKERTAAWDTRLAWQRLRGHLPPPARERIVTWLDPAEEG